MKMHRCASSSSYIYRADPSQRTSAALNISNLWFVLHVLFLAIETNRMNSISKFWLAGHGIRIWCFHFSKKTTKVLKALMKHILIRFHILYFYLRLCGYYWMATWIRISMYCVRLIAKKNWNSQEIKNQKMRWENMARKFY